MGASSNHLWTLTPPCFTLRAAGTGGSFFRVAPGCPGACDCPLAHSITSSATRLSLNSLPLGLQKMFCLLTLLSMQPYKLMLRPRVDHASRRRGGCVAAPGAPP